MEVIILYNPMPNATYTVTVTPHSVSITQPYALIISGEIGEFSYTPKKDPYLVIIAAIIVLVLSGCALFSIWDCCCRGCWKKRKKAKEVGVEPTVATAGLGKNRQAPPDVAISQPESTHDPKKGRRKSTKGDSKRRRSSSSGSKNGKARGSDHISGESKSGDSFKKMRTVPAESFEDMSPPDVLF